MDIKKPIQSFRDLDVYQRAYNAMLVVAQRVLDNLPAREKFDLASQISRSSKAIPRLIAEGYAKKHQKFGFQKYLDDAMAESNETVVSLEQCRDLYHVDEEVIAKLVSDYTIISKQLYKLAEAWDSFKNTRRKSPKDQ
ncbi:MAG: four helix bundle protein [Parcubacteria group bacterium CG1_02_44_31]|nr:MAG: four helix bundle protein [Parcubacteria group bacterium CG1_02_44_31]